MIGRGLRRLGKVLLVVLLALLVLVAALPSILSMPAVRRAVLARVNAQLGGGSLTVRRWSFGWRSGVSIEGAAFQDGEERYGATLESFSISAGLFKLLAPTKNFGSIEVVAPHAWCDLDRLEAAVAKPPATEKPGHPGKPPATEGERIPLALDVIAKLVLKDVRVEARKAGQPTTVLSLDGNIDCRSLKKPVTFSILADCRAGDTPRPANGAQGLKFEGSALLLKDGVLDPAAMVATILCEAHQFDLAGLAAARAAVPALPAIGGQIDSTLNVKVNGLNEFSAAGSMALHNLDLKGGALGLDRPHLDEVVLDVDVTRRGWNLTVKQFVLRSAPATFKAAGALAPVAGAKYPRGQITFIGNVDLASLAAQLPHTLKMPDATRVQGGAFQVSGKAEGVGDALRMQVKASLRELQGTQAGAAFQQSAPIDLAATASLTPTGPVIDAFVLTSSFASASGGGNVTGALFNVRADLAAAAREVGQVVDLGAGSVAGMLRATVQLDMQSPAARRVVVDAALKGFSVSGLASRPGMESVPDMTGELGARATVVLGEGGAVDVKGALQGNALELRGGALGQDRPRMDLLRVDADVAMVEPGMHGATPSSRRSGPTALHSENTGSSNGGRLASAAVGHGKSRIVAPFRPVIDIRAFAIDSPLIQASASGRVEMVAGAMYPNMAMEIGANLNLAALAKEFPHALHIKKPDVHITAGTLKLDGALKSDGAALAWDARAALAAVAATRGPQALRLAEPVHAETRGELRGKVPRIDALRVTSGFAQVDAKGDLAKADVSVRVDLEKAMTEVGQFVNMGKLRVGGQLVATLAVNGPSAPQQGIALDAQIDKFVLSDIPVTESVTLVTRIARTADGVQLQTFDLKSAPVDLQATGQLTALSTDRQLKLTGRLGSDCGQIALLTEAFTGFKPDMAGKATRDFVFDAPLSAGDGIAIARRTEAKAGLHADRFSAFGVTATAIDLALAVHEARAQVLMDTDVNEGHLHAEPYLDLRGPKPVLMLPENSELLKGVKINDEMASKLLARIHPIFLGCVIVGGTLDLKMDSLRAPLGERIQQETEFKGGMDLADLRLGPGQGLLGQILSATGVQAQETTIPDQHISFVCSNGRIVPSPLVIAAEGQTITLSGSVGLDQTLQYQAEMPVTETMVSKAIYPYLQGTSIKIPIGGTVSAPRFDRDAFVRAIAELTVKAGRNLATEELKKRVGDETRQKGSKVLEDLLKGLSR